MGPMASAPLSFGQERMWLLQQMAGSVPLCTIPNAVRLRGPLDVAALRQALAALQARHQALRVRFAVGDQVTQHLVDEPISVQTIDCAEDQLDDAIAAAIVEPFDLTAELPFRVHLLRMSADDHVLLVNADHAVCDIASVVVLLRELAALYAGDPLAEPGVGVVDAAIAERSAPVDADALDYWRRALADPPTPLELPADFAVPPQRSHRGRIAHRVLPPALSGRLVELARQSGSTEMVFLLTAFAVLLARYSGRRDFVIGVPFRSRDRREQQNSVGMFLNTVAMRCDLDGEPTFLELVGRLRAQSIAAHEHHTVPFELVLDAIQPARDTSRQVALPVFFDTLVDSEPGLALPGIEPASVWPPWELHNGAAKADLHMRCWHEDGQLVLCCEYATDLWQAQSVERLLGNFETLLGGIAADPSRSVWVLPLLRSAELGALRAWNDTATDYPRDATLGDLLRRACQEHRDRVAVEDGDQSWTYGELRDAAASLAVVLRQRGVGPDVLVGLCTKRSIERLVGLVAILFAGGAWLALEPDQPESRLRLLIDDAELDLVLVGPDCSVPATGTAALPIDATPTPGAVPPLPLGGGDSLAYVTYTSGTTGQPNGVCVTHRNLLRWAAAPDFVELGPSSVVLHVTALSFDVAAFELFAALLFGGRLVLAPDGAISLDELGATIRNHNVDTVWLTGSLFHAMVDHQCDDLRGVRQIAAGGEALSRPHVERVFERLPDTVVINGYGPTENGIFTCCAVLRGREDLARTVPIGPAVANTELHVLDDHSQRVPVGVVGELWAGGDGLARGYLRRPELTAERFVDDPQYGRLYRTGDLVRRLPDGRLEFLERRDTQVKLRGHRVELGEIEAAVAAHPQVASAAAVLVGEGEAARLVAYFVPRDGTAPTAEALRQCAGEKLLRPLVPSVFVEIEALPRTRNGKLDRRALAARKPPAPQTSSSPPRSEIERTIAGLWSEVLEIDEVGIDDNFFDLGGNSLRLARVWARLRALAGRDITIVEMFEFPTVASLAARWQQDGEQQVGQETVAQDRAQARREAGQRLQSRRG